MIPGLGSKLLPEPGFLPNDLVPYTSGSILFCIGNPLTALNLVCRKLDQRSLHGKRLVGFARLWFY